MTDELELYDDELAHIGVLHKSGRYPWGSGENPHQRSQGFLDYVSDMRKEGLSDSQIAKAMDIKTPELRANQTIAKNVVKKADIARALQLREKKMSNMAIGKAMGRNESSVRALLSEDAQVRATKLDSTVDILKRNVADKKFVDVGVGTEHHLGVSDFQVKTAVAQLLEEGYQKFYLKIPQLGTKHDTMYQILAPPDATFKELIAEQGNIKNATITDYSEDGGLTYQGLVKPKQVSSKRIAIRYGPDGGTESDGVIQVRRGVDDISLGNARYAQVRIAVDDTHYLKGMAMYADDLPDGVDMVFNTNKTKANMELAVASGKAPNIKLAAMKEQNLTDPVNPFGSIVRQKHYVDVNGKEQLSALNLVNEEGVWATWSSKLSSQFLSKQPHALAKEQLGVRYDSKKSELEDILELTNPVVKKKLLDSFADAADSSAGHLKAAGLPRTKTHVILPINSLKDNEIYAPQYNNGERVVLVRHPHGGKFEIPELVVNNKNSDAKRLIQNAQDAVGINATVAQRLSGADFDGDTVLVIPNDNGKVKTSPALLALKTFDPQTAYKGYEGMKVMSGPDKQHKMGDISNLITDMTVGGASQAELARAVKHSMVVIDAEKHKLNYKQSAKDQNISELKVKYQGSARSGAKTLISRASSRADVNLRKPRSADNGGPIDLDTGRLMYDPVKAEKGTYIIPAHDRVSPKLGKVTHVPEELKFKTFRSTQMAEVNDARDLISPLGTPIEGVYANYANGMKALANTARKAYHATVPIKINPSAKVVYVNETQSLKAKLNRALKNAPLERQAQVVGNALLKAKMDSNPGMDNSDIKKAKSQSLDEARIRVGAKKFDVVITDPEWAAIQAGAISTNVLEKILNSTDIERVKTLATPRTTTAMPSAKIARANSMLASGYTQYEVAAALGVSVSTLTHALHPKK